MFDEIACMKHFHNSGASITEIFDYVYPYWTEHAVLLNADEQYIIAQVHAMVMRRRITNNQIEERRWVIMDRLRKEEAARRNCGVDDLYLYYPHHLVDKEYPPRVSWHMGLSDKDYEIMIAAAKKVGYNETLSSRDAYHIESMSYYLSDFLINCRRRYIRIG